MKRLETGPLQCDNDWPGIFIRGDNSAWFSMSLGAVLAAISKGENPDPISLCGVKELQKLLGSAIITNGTDPSGLQHVKLVDE